ncbi:hypothetical protein CAS74_004920 [Pichia kudriavzevii]|uniref:Pre-mRNA-splicing factor PRP46 n=1 Tax=Pichia kudriavzevii TaxID=4909 RepID=A0A1Z8JHW7_PICKU|nr:hypothetical protein CAS74_004920 [Pichia kudriavzevii]
MSYKQLKDDIKNIVFEETTDNAREIYHSFLRNRYFPDYLYNMRTTSKTSILYGLRDLPIDKLDLPIASTSLTLRGTATIPTPTINTPTSSSCAFDPENRFFVTGSSDRTIKVWDTITSELQYTLTSHIMSVTDMAISARHPYLFSVSEDKTVKCWDLEKNSVIRDYHGHLSAVYSVDVHPDLDIFVRVWDIRTRLPIHVLTGHRSFVNKVKCESDEPQVISCSSDSTVKTWDLRMGKVRDTITYHAKSVRSFCVNEDKHELVSGSSDGVKKFTLDCKFLQDWQVPKHDVLEHGNLIINTLSTKDGVVFAGFDDGKFAFWDWETGEMFQNGQQPVVPGSLANEGGILCSTFDQSGEMLVSGSIDKSIRIWRKDT